MSAGRFRGSMFVIPIVSALLLCSIAFADDPFSQFRSANEVKRQKLVADTQAALELAAQLEKSDPRRAGEVLRNAQRKLEVDVLLSKANRDRLFELIQRCLNALPSTGQEKIPSIVKPAPGSRQQDTINRFKQRMINNRLPNLPFLPESPREQKPQEDIPARPGIDRAANPLPGSDSTKSGRQGAVRG